MKARTFRRWSARGAVSMAGSFRVFRVPCPGRRAVSSRPRLPRRSGVADVVGPARLARRVAGAQARAVHSSRPSCYTRGHRHARAPRHRLSPRRPRAVSVLAALMRSGAARERARYAELSDARPPSRGAARALHAPRGDRRDGGGDLPRAQPAAHGHPQLRPQRLLHAREAARRRGGGEDQPPPHLRAGGPGGADRQPHARAHAPGRPHDGRDRRQQRRARDRRLPDAPDAPLAGRGDRVAWPTTCPRCAATARACRRCSSTCSPTPATPWRRARCGASRSGRRREPGAALPVVLEVADTGIGFSEPTDARASSSRSSPPRRAATAWACRSRARS